MWGNQGGFSGYGGGGGAEGGGGFMSSPGFNSPQAGGPGGEKGQKRARATNLIPCSVADIMTAENVDGAYKVCGGRQETGQVSVLGLVKAVRELPTRIEYEIDDCTGPILDVRLFTDQGEDGGEQRAKAFPENSFILVHGHIREINNKRMLAAFKVSPVEDMNLLTTHLLEIVYSRLYWTRAQDENMNMDTGGVKAEGGGGTFQGGGGSDAGFYSGFSPAQAQVHRIIQSSVSEQGVSIHQLATECRGLNERQIKDAIEFLSGEGHIYSTIDEEHYKTTDS